MWIRQQLSYGVFKSVKEVEKAVKAAINQLVEGEAPVRAPARLRYTPEGSPEPYQEE